MAKKSGDVRPKITLACTECKERNYITKKNRRNNPDRMEMAKFCPRCRKHTARDPLRPGLEPKNLKRGAALEAAPRAVWEQLLCVSN